jgi:hypothetical protein
MAFDFRDLSQFDHEDPTVRPLGMRDNPVATLQALYAHAIEMRAFYLARGEVITAAKWYGQGMAFACLLRDNYDWDAGFALVTDLGIREETGRP